MQLNVRDYGASGDGQTKDAVVIQAALDEANRVKSGITVWIPEGTYRLEKTLYVSSKTHVIAAPGTRLVKDHNGYLVTNGRPEESFEKYSGHSDIVIEGGIWDFNGTKRKVMHNCFAFGHGDNITLEGMEIRDVAGAHAVEICGCRNVRISNCRFLGFINTGGRNFSEAVQIDLMKAKWVFSAFGAYDQTPCDNVWISGCYFGSSGTDGSQVWPRGIGSHSSTIGVWHQNIKVQNNVFEGLTMQAVRGYSWRNVQIQHNQMISCGAGIEAASPILSDAKDTKNIFGKQTGGSQPCENIQIVHNTITGGLTYHHGIHLAGERSGVLANVLISGNIISDPVQGSAFSGISIRHGQTVNVTNNILGQIKGTSIAVEVGSRIVLNNNMITFAWGDGISVSDHVVGVDLKNNFLQYIWRNGIVISGNVGQVVILGNTIYGVNGEGSKTYPITAKLANEMIISMNVYKNEGKKYHSDKALHIASSCRNVWENGNYFSGLT
ncbi:glycosyl hydrolase family 28-related protein [Virgibacillus senegalensis]|uniref:glycosyl hydrolase family 28-related protein n=1 Tax=Virgibacillus senegalensis TaxID=1499679 RepID=UPI00069F243D|nr:right-handed parallel beta-helix repeat-containing protein [Virgibacillus senegalensis]